MIISHLTDDKFAIQIKCGDKYPRFHDLQTSLEQAMCLACKTSGSLEVTIGPT